jgi:hypothetical protein
MFGKSIVQGEDQIIASFNVRSTPQVVNVFPLLLLPVVGYDGILLIGAESVP